VILWKAVCSNKLLANVDLVLFLNKCDILDAKLQSGISIAKYVKSYGDRGNDVESVSKCECLLAELMLRCLTSGCYGRYENQVQRDTSRLFTYTTQVVCILYFCHGMTGPPSPHDSSHRRAGYDYDCRHSRKWYVLLSPLVKANMCVNDCGIYAVRDMVVRQNLRQSKMV
jgi:hypothetical protein